MTHQIRTTAPPRGHFFSVGPMPLATPPVLYSDHGVFAYRMSELGTHSAMYALEAFGETIPVGGVLDLREALPSDPIPMFWRHPAVADDPAEIIPTVSIDGRSLGAPRITLDEESPVHQRFQLDYIGEGWGVRIWLTIMARSPVVRGEMVVVRLDRTKSLAVVSVDAEEEIAWAYRPGNNVYALDRGEVGLRKFAICCRNRAGDAKHDLADALDRANSLDILADQTEFAIQAIQGNYAEPFTFLPAKWDGDWLNAPVVTHPEAARWRETVGPRFTSARGANQGGSQQSLGPTFSAPLWSDPDPKFVPVLWRCATDWAKRPVHILEPGTLDPVSPARAGKLLTVMRQVHNVSELQGQQLPTHGTRTESGSTGHDEQHMADMPLLAAYACTGSPALRWIMESHSALDLMQKRPIAGWRNNGRGEGRTGFCMLASAKLLGGDRAAKMVAHIEKRLSIAQRDSDTRHLPDSAPCRPLELHDVQHIGCPPPLWQCYEDAQFAWSSWVLYRETGSRAALEQAYRSGMAVATTIWNESGQWCVPYAVTQMADGSALKRSDLHSRSPLLVYSGTWPLWWSGCGLRALMNAIAEDPTILRIEHRQHYVSAIDAMAWLQTQTPADACNMHHALAHAMPPRIMI